MIINIDLIYERLPALLHGARISLQIAASACVIGFSLGTLLGLLQTSKNNIITTAVNTFVGIIRGTPMFLQIYLVFYLALPMLRFNSSAYWAAIIAIGLNSSAYISQVIRSGINSIDKGQWEAAQVLGLTQIQTMWYIIFPQALRAALPSLGNEFITLIKDSSLASIIGVTELMFEAKAIQSETYDAITVYCAVGVMYLLMTIPLSYGMNYLEKRMGRYAHH